LAETKDPMFGSKKNRVLAEGITMRRENAIIATILIFFAPRVHAGVVMSETEVRSGLGSSTTIDKTVYVQGKKQKIETSHEEKIIDLEKGVLYEIDPNRKIYVRKAFPPKTEHEVAGAAVKLSAVALKKTGRSRSIDGYSCEEYRALALRSQAHRFAVTVRWSELNSNCQATSITVSKPC
jgi:hypothetical protein